MSTLEPTEAAADVSEQEADPDKQWRENLGFEEEDVSAAGKRCAVQWTPWMGDWFTSSSPRNGNTNAEGPWDHWVDLALHILADPMTKLVRPEVFEESYRGKDFYSGADRYLTDAELRARFDRAVKA
jgi:hypothetical protein